MNRKQWMRSAAFAVALSCAGPSFAACMNKYIFRTQEATKQVMTLLTGKLTFQEAQGLAKAINEKKASPLEWVDTSGKTIAKQFGDLKVVRPMPVGCDDKTSGVVVTATFLSISKPSGRIYLKLNSETAVPFDEQKD